ncbi:hypothetical protein BU24DRAFT_446676 [Aaosphaeria arxii CBS 175.79]|uniref:Uncharacterized protein n=1 Tax=Aaosphaeria arxii CBS 175.79 TaxID=1450172 RepID=A0A6A5YAD5_9PLEO|nr:uncharacterized protein BU24DRAFT_446676 [Aaosphaeria arxii CBS 175.79]KAF2021721.1 hypothetical protein BU24DRAFT_446676 [Aaosphaeria arxii CBS 175.79]
MYFRDNWVADIYTAMISTDKATDGPTSCYLRRIKTMSISPADLEAAAHHVFDTAITVHEKGWCRPLMYHSEARGQLRFRCMNNILDRLIAICECLAHSKAAVNDAIQGGVPLHRLVNNPRERMKTKQWKNRSNALRKRQLEAGIKALKDDLESKMRKTSEEALRGVNDASGDDEDYQE